MKIAVCLSGQPRFLRHFAPSIIKNLILPNNADVFIHSWYSEEATKIPVRSGVGWADISLERDSDKLLLEIYKPIDAIIEPQIDFPLWNIDHLPTRNMGYGGGSEKSENGDYFVKAFQSMWYGIMRSQLLRKQYSLINKFQYDYVVRCRLDCQIHTPILFSNLDVNKLHHCHLSDDQKLIHDWFNIGSEKTMDIMASMYWKLKSFYDNSCIWCNEYWLKLLMQENKIEDQRHPWPISIISKEI
ncbi:MAG TPA: hypothetical protein PLD02_03990 [Saprospiraceae bacterium]|nr:hypothetical protein [Saprospiraceae bacterium]